MKQLEMRDTTAENNQQRKRGVMRRASYKIGDKVRLSADGRENECYRKFWERTLTVCDVSRSRKDHPGFDEAAGSALYDFEECPFSLYEWEMERV